LPVAPPLESVVIGSASSPLNLTRGLVSLDHSASIEGSAHRSLDSIPSGILLRRSATAVIPCAYRFVGTCRYTPGRSYDHTRHATSVNVKNDQHVYTPCLGQQLARELHFLVVVLIMEDTSSRLVVDTQTIQFSLFFLLVHEPLRSCKQVVRRDEPVYMNR
jgi:hypothetical protein